MYVEHCVVLVLPLMSRQSYGARYALPRELREYKVVCAGADKPLVALALLRALGAERVIVFTSSVESTQRCRPRQPHCVDLLNRPLSALRVLGAERVIVLASSADFRQQCCPWRSDPVADCPSGNGLL